MRKRRLGLLLLLAGALFWLGQGMWAAAGMGSATSSSNAIVAKATTTDAAKPVASPKKSSAAPTPAPSASTMLLPSRPVLGATLADAVAAAQGQGKAKGKVTRDQVYVEKFQKMAPSEIKAAAKRQAAMGLKPGVAGRTDLVAAASLTPADFAGTTEGPGGIPHYFGPYGNWAFSPLPKGGIAEITVTSPGTGYVTPVVTITDVYGTGSGATATAVGANGVIYGFTILTAGSGYQAPVVVIEGDGIGATATAIANAAGAITGFNITSGGSGYTTATVTITDDPNFCGDPLAPCGTGAEATALIGNGGIVGITVTAPGAGYSAPWVTITDAGGIGAGATGDAAIGGTLAGGIQKFIDRLPQLGPGGANNVIQEHGQGQYLPVGVPTPCSYSGQDADCYAVGLVEYSEKLHTNLPKTKLRGYVQLETPELLAHIAAVNTDGDPTNDIAPSKSVPVGGGKLAYDHPHYLGPIVVAQGRAQGVAGPAGQPKPVRVTFYNLLPTGAGGNLFIPVDETIPGAGVGPGGVGASGTKYTQNRATVHLHGNNTVWISDGNTHQWITPAGEATPYPAGASARNVPDMGPGCDADPLNAPGLPGVTDGAGNGTSSGCMTFFYTNAQSARLQFYHDHAHGITRLNVYVGQAAGYVLTDAVEQDLIKGTNVTGVNPGLKKVLPGLGIPLVIQDRTFVEKETVFSQDPTWNWGTGLRGGDGKITEAVTGDLWYPHVYMTVQSPTDPFGANPFGKWHYGPWFNPPVPDCNADPRPGCIEVGVVPNEYYDPINAPWEPPMRPGVPNPSLPGESFLDTPLVNGTAYPYLEVEPKAYRFRLLNAGNDRFLNLSLYQAHTKESWVAGTGVENPGTATVPCPQGAADRTNCTEMKMIPVSAAPANQFADTPSGVPDPATAGPDWWMIGTEGGFMPAPVAVPPSPIGWNLDMGFFAFGIVNQHSLFLGSAERADVVVDFSEYAGKTLILYNDSPAPVPAGASVYDHYTGDGNQMDAGGAPNTQPGYGPNTRTIMQIRVGNAVTTPTTDVTWENLQAAWAKGPDPAKRGVFELSQDPIVIPQAAYNSAYNQSFPTSFSEQHLQIADTQKTFKPLDATGALQASSVTIPLEMKAMHDEMGGVYDVMYGRMSGMLGLVNPNSNVHLLIPYGYGAPPTDLVKGSAEGPIQATQMGTLADGTQIWRIFHNGVDTHPIHTHLFHAQVINRVDQSGLVVGDPVDVIEHGWKDTIRVNPLEVTFLALRPTVPLPSQLPFEVPDSIRLIDPGLPEGAQLPNPAPAGWFDPLGNQLEGAATPVNNYVNFGWEYVWHCHILSHEEMDMMHSLVFAVPPRPPINVGATWNGNANNPRITLNWKDDSIREVGFTVQRATDIDFTTGVTTLTGFTTPDLQTTTVGPAAGTGATVQYTDTSVARNSTYYYRVFANGAVVGDTFTQNFPTMAVAAPSLTVGPTSTFGAALGTPAAPTSLTATVQTGPRVNVVITDAANNETGFVLERCTGEGCNNFAPIATLGPSTANNPSSTGRTVSYPDTGVTFGNTYLYRVKAINGTAASVYFPVPPATVSATVPLVPSQPASFTVAVTKNATGNGYTAALAWTAPTTGPVPVSYTIQRSLDQEFLVVQNSQTITPAVGAPLSTTQTVSRNTVYYYRIRANNGLGGSSFWTKAVPFPIRTGR